VVTIRARRGWGLLAGGSLGLGGGHDHFSREANESTVGGKGGPSCESHLSACWPRTSDERIMRPPLAWHLTQAKSWNRHQVHMIGVTKRVWASVVHGVSRSILLSSDRRLSSLRPDSELIWTFPL